MAEYEYEYYSGSEIWPNTKLFGVPLSSEYEYEHLDYLNITEYEYKQYQI